MNKFILILIMAVIVSGIVQINSVYAQSVSGSDSTDGANAPAVVQPATDPGDPGVVFDGGGPALMNGREMTSFAEASDFELTKDTLLADAHFWTLECDPPAGNGWDGTLEYRVYDDDSGLPGAVIASGNGVNVMKTATGNTGSLLFDACDIPVFPTEYEYWFDLEVPIALESGTKYWLALHLASDFANRDNIYWEDTAAGFDLPGAFSFGSFDDWGIFVTDGAFFLTEKIIVGGEFLPIDATALLVAGAQTNAVWILSVLVGIASVAFGTLYLTTKRN